MRSARDEMNVRKDAPVSARLLSKLDSDAAADVGAKMTASNTCPGAARIACGRVLWGRFEGKYPLHNR